MARKLAIRKNNASALLETVLLALFFFFQLAVVIPLSALVHEAAGQLEPVGSPEFGVAAGDLLVRGRRLAPFQLCLACKCCVSAAEPATCSTMPCCFGIDCQLPNKPFGVCAFVPKICSCTSCAI